MLSVHFIEDCIPANGAEIKVNNGKITVKHPCGCGVIIDEHYSPRVISYICNQHKEQYQKYKSIHDDGMYHYPRFKDEHKFLLDRGLKQ